MRIEARDPGVGALVREIMMEVEASAQKIGERLGVPMPGTRALYACTKLLDNTSCQKETTQ